MPTIKLLHTNDFHNHFSSTQATRLAALRRDLCNSGLLLDAGDAVSAGNITYHLGGEPILELMSDAGYDAMTVGNREFHFTRKGFAAKLNRARFPVLCANVRCISGSSESAVPVVPSITRILDVGTRVSVFGLTVPMITERMLVRKVSAFVFDDPINIARKIVPSLRKDCDLLVCLSHIGLAKDRELAKSVPDIDLIVGGHTHATLTEGERIGDTLIVQAGWWGHSFGTVECEIGQGKPRLTAKIEPL